MLTLPENFQIMSTYADWTSVCRHCLKKSAYVDIRGFHRLTVTYTYTRQQKKCPVVQISVTSKIFGRFLSIMYQIKQHIMWVHLISFYDSIFAIDDSANSWKWTNEIASNKPSNMHFRGCLSYRARNFKGNWYIWTL